VLSRIHWVRPELAAEVKFLLLRQVVYEGLREDKPAAEVHRSPPYPTVATAKRGSQGRGYKNGEWPRWVDSCPSPEAAPTARLRRYQSFR
jgi:hypothetical protein